MTLIILFVYLIRIPHCDGSYLFSAIHLFLVLQLYYSRLQIVTSSVLQMCSTLQLSIYIVVVTLDLLFQFWPIA
jgi:hypothetical protein